MKAHTKIATSRSNGQAFLFPIIKDFPSSFLLLSSSFVSGGAVCLLVASSVSLNSFQWFIICFNLSFLEACIISIPLQLSLGDLILLEDVSA